MLNVMCSEMQAANSEIVNTNRKKNIIVKHLENFDNIEGVYTNKSRVNIQ